MAEVSEPAEGSEWLRPLLADEIHALPLPVLVHFPVAIFFPSSFVTCGKLCSLRKSEHNLCGSPKLRRIRQICRTIILTVEVGVRGTGLKNQGAHCLEGLSHAWRGKVTGIVSNPPSFRQGPHLPLPLPLPHC